MRCGKAQRLISAGLDGELAEAGVRAVKEHAAACTKCREFAADLARLSEGLDSLTVSEPRWGFADRLLARLPQPQSGHAATGGWPALLRPAPLGLAAAAFCFGVVLTLLVTGDRAADASPPQSGVEVQAGDYLAALSEDAVEERLLALLPATEE